jgi:hypothetical protein
MSKDKCDLGAILVFEENTSFTGAFAIYSQLVQVGIHEINSFSNFSTRLNAFFTILLPFF